jgi:hypothetical protein
MRASRLRVDISALFSPCSALIQPSIDYKFEPSDDPPPHDDDEARRREEEELQRVLELSVQDKGGRKNWNEYSLASSSGAGGSGSAASQASPQASTARQPAVPALPPSSSSTTSFNQHAYATGYVPSTDPHTQTTAPTTVESSPRSTSAAPTSPTSSTAEAQAVTRVRALHSFEPTEPNELAFEKGDVIKVVNREYKDWWRGQLKGRTGIFPVNYVVRLRANPLHFAFPSANVWWCIGTSSGTLISRAGSRSTAGSRRVLAGGQRRSIVDDAAHSGPGKG